MSINTCPSCGGNKIRRVKRTLTRTFRGRKYQVPDLEFEECPDCREKLFDREAMRLIKNCSPAYRKSQPKMVSS